MLWSRLHIITLLICVPITVHAQTANFEDDFTDQDISDWSGSTDDFIFLTENNNVLLQQNALAAGSSFLSIPSTDVVGYWEFFIRLDGFSPSDGNKAEIYLMSDSSDLNGTVNGYMLQAGENLSGDVFRLFKITAGAKDGEILTGITDISTGGDFRVKVIRDDLGNWSLEVAQGYTGLLVQEATGTDDTYTSASHFGFKTTYTSTRTDRFAFDFKIDVPPITVTDVTLANDTEIDISFNKAYDPASVQTSDFTLQPGSLNPQSFNSLSAESLRVSFTNPLPGGINNLDITGINDLSGSTTLTDTTFMFIVYDDFNPGDVVINEFMKDPPAGTAEYVEILNVSGKYLNLKDWQIGDNGSWTTIASTDTPLLPNDFAVISADTTALNTYYGSANYILASLPTLNNGEDEVRLLDNTGSIADSLYYDGDWGGIDIAIERRDPTATSIYLENWDNSPNPKFGTPGSANEVLADTVAPQVIEVLPSEPLTLFLVSSERLDNTSAENANNYNLGLNPASGAITPEIPNIVSANQIAADTVYLTLDSELREYDGTWDLDVSTLRDIFGNNAPGVYEFDFQNPFYLSELTVITNSQLLLEFTEEVDLNSVQPTDFTINNSTLDPATGITQPQLNQIQLDLINPLSSGPNNLFISDLQSINGWTINANTTQEFFLFDTFIAGDVIINEFMKDPPLGATDFVEIRNLSGKYLNLKNWQIGDELSLIRISGSDLVIYPDSFAVITPDSSALISTFGPAYYIQAALPNLNSTTPDQVRLLTSSGATADSLEYSNSWGGENVSLERRDPTVSSVFQENWGDSPSPDLGTPGYSNVIETDNKPPQLSEATLINRSELQLVYSERIKEVPATLVSNYALQAENIIDPNVSILSVSYTEPDTVLLRMSGSLPSEPEGTTYELTIENQTDLFGNVSQPITRSLFVIDYATADSGDVFITEFMNDPADGFTDFIELYNPTDSAYNLQNWTFNDNSGNRRLLTGQQRTLLPHSWTVMAPDSSLSASFPDTDLLVMGSAFANLNSTTPDDIVIRNADGALIDSLRYDNSWGGEKISLERRSIGVSPSYIENWGPSPSPQLATPGTENLIDGDLNAPEISELSVLSNNRLKILFNERIQNTAAENPSNYTLQGPPEISDQIPAIATVTFSEPDSVLLQFENELPRQDTGTTYELRVENQQDVFGNTAEILTESFFIIYIQEADSGDVVINEFMYDPGVDYSEFIELYNNSNKNIDLNRWTLNDNTGTRRNIASTTTEFIQGSHVVLLPDSTLLELFPDKNLIVLGSAFPSLNNGADDIVIRNQHGTLMDSLSYTSGWGGDQVSLERLDPDAPSFYAENWADSPSKDLATPGRKNEVVPDNIPPIITQGFTVGPEMIRIRYDERVSSSSALDPYNYTILPNIGINRIQQTSGNEITISLASAMTDGTTYKITVKEQTDIFGNLQSSETIVIEFTQFSNALPGDIVINEILYRRLTGDSPEFIELFNQSDKNIDLSNWIFADASNSTSLPSETQIRRGEYLVITDVENFTAAKARSTAFFNGEIVYLPGFPSLNDNEDAVIIKNETGLVIDSLNYKNTWGGDSPGVSLERKDPLSASNDPNNWSSSKSETGNTAGNRSSVFEADIEPPQVIFANTIENNRISLVFSEFVVPDNATLTLNGNHLSIYNFDPETGNQLITEPYSTSPDEALILSVSGMKDYRGNTSGELKIEVSKPITPGSVVINEIMFDPLAEPDDNLPDQTEYIELYNRSDHAKSLEGVFLHDAPDENNDVRSIDPVSSQYKWIPPNGYFLIYADDQATDFSNSRLAQFFEISESTEDFKIRVNRSSLSLGSSGDAIFLADSTGEVIDSVFYDESWHNPNIFDKDGIALERIDPHGPGNNETNWSSSTRVNGGTPGEQNSIFQQSGSLPEKSGLSFSPNPFSPDDDGFDDNLFINYKLDESDYLLRVRIFDRYGRLVRHLANGIPSGFEGSLIWDGLTDAQKRNRVGIYIVLFEAYDSANGKNRTFKETVVLARKF